MRRYDYNVMPGQAWYQIDGYCMEADFSSFHPAAAYAKELWNKGVRDIIINVYDNIEEDIADFFYSIDDTGKVIKR